MDISYPLYTLHWALSLLGPSLGRSCLQSRERCRTLEEFGIDPSTGFFPPEVLPHLPQPFDIWEQAFEQAADVLALGSNEDEEALEKREGGCRWRQQVNLWPTLDTSRFYENRRFLQRAHMVLAWLVHFYAHSTPQDQNLTNITIPRSLAVPLVKVSQMLGIAPILTFADTVLWNVEAINPRAPLSIENFRIVNCFSGTEDERNFYRTSAQVEMRGIEALSIINRYINLPDPAERSNNNMVTRDLARLGRIIDDLTETMNAVREGVDPKIFYWAVRPWFKGSDVNGSATSRWIFEGVPDTDELDLSGPSAGQSSIMHAIDIFLDVDHKLLYKRCPIPSVKNMQADFGFMERMRRYMPGSHREFLDHIGEVVSVRELAERTPVLQGPYNSAVRALKKLRDMHIRIACLYIVSMSNSTPPPGFSGKPEEDGRGVRKPARGTGGTGVSALLKAGRDATRRALIK